MSLGFLFFKQKTAYELRIRDWSSDVCSSDLLHIGRMDQYDNGATIGIDHGMAFASHGLLACVVATRSACFGGLHALAVDDCRGWCWFSPCPDAIDPNEMMRSEERRVGKEGVSTCRSRWLPDHKKNKTI